MPRTAETAAKLSAHLWAALGYLAKKRTNRGLIPAGSETPIDVVIEGKVGRSKICERVAGKIQLGYPQDVADSSAAPIDQVVAAILDRFEPADRYEVMQAILNDWADGQTLSELPADQVKEAAGFLAQLRSKSTKTKAGALTFALNQS